jgi:hypothetical protein
MMREVTKAIVDAINKNQATALGLLASIVGTLLGVAGSFFLERWRQRGKLVIQVIKVHKRGAPNWESAKQYCASFSLRILNSFPIEKSLAVLGVSYYASRPRPWTTVKALWYDPAPSSGYESGQAVTDQDFQLAPRVFTRLYINSATTYEGEIPPSDITTRVHSVRWVRIDFLASPKQRVSFWFDMTKADFDTR